MAISVGLLYPVTETLCMQGGTAAVPDEAMDGLTTVAFVMSQVENWYADRWKGQTCFL